MTRSSDLAELVVLNIELSGVVLDQMTGQLDVILNHAKTAEVLLQEGSLNEGGIADNLEDL